MRNMRPCDLLRLPLARLRRIKEGPITPLGLGEDATLAREVHPMKKLISLAAALLTAAAVTVASADPSEAHGRGRWVAGLAFGLAAGAILHHHYRRHHHYYYPYYYSYYPSYYYYDYYPRYYWRPHWRKYGHRHHHRRHVPRHSFY
jgi:hypothetical protein